ncbi:MAG: hypothetical protein JWN01_92 [Patescibacteria group bacterium]|nr:hypothetical protein [Patescibacteria group bacterium]
MKNLARRLLRLTVAEKLVLALGGLSGLVLLVLVPPFQVADEATHFYRAYEVSQGRFIARRLATGTGDELPRSLSQSFAPFTYMMFDPGAKMRLSLLRSELRRPLDPGRTRPTRFENTSLYPPVSYAPQALAIAAGRLFQAPPVVLLYLARLAGLVVWLGLILLAVRRLPAAGLAIAALAITPMALYQAVSASGDATTMGLAFLLVAQAIAYARRTTPLTDKQLAGVIITALLLALCKAPYVLLVLLVVIIPRRQVAGRRYLALLAGAVVMPLLVAGGWAVVAQHNFVNLRAGVDQSAQLQFILHHPYGYAANLWRTFATTVGDYLAIQFIGILGWLDTKLPIWAVIADWFVIGLAVLCAPPAGLLRRWQRAWAGLVGLGAVVAIATLLYLTWTAPKAPAVEGLQGRYFIPLSILLLAVGGGWLSGDVVHRRLSLTIAGLMSIVLIATLAVVGSRYY